LITGAYTAISGVAAVGCVDVERGRGGVGMGVGEALAAAREEAGLTVEDVSRSTRIRGELVRRIEAGDYEACGGAVYARGHIRSIAAALGLDPAPFLADFDREHGNVAPPAAREIFEREVVAMPERSGTTRTPPKALTAAVLLIVALVSLCNTNNTPPDDPGVRALTSSSPTPKPSTAVTPSARPTQDAIAGQVPGSGVFLRVKVVNSRSYVTVRADGKTIFQGLMQFPSQKDFTAKKTIHLVIGNAAAVQLVVNGRELGSPGRPGDVVKLDFGPGDPTAG
jgi:transcriptional regulator with XRE-family HTH domain